MPLQATSGAASYDAFGGGVPAPLPNYIEDVFSTWLYTGNGTSQTITNGIDLSSKGGFVWIKSRSNSENHAAFDTSRGVNKYLLVNTDFAELNYSGFGITAFNSSGFSVAGGGGYAVNTSAYTYASWTFREQAKFFDVVTYTGTGANRTIAHNLGSVAGCIIVKRIDADANWQVYHRSLANTEYLVLNTTNAKATGATRWNSTTPTSTVFSLGTDATVNASGGTYVAYLFAHDAGGFGLLGTDNVISCGSYVGDGTTRLINIGYEPQWILIKNADSTDAFSADNWKLIDNMRGFTATNNSAILTPNLNDAEFNDDPITIASQGFNTNNFRATGKTYIYIAIRRGPMKVPTTGTSVFAIDQNTSSPFAMTSGFPVDSWWYGERAGSAKWYDFDRLRGNFYLQQNTAGAESAFTVKFDNMTGVALTSSNATGFIQYAFKRAPSFFDEVCYTGTGSTRTVTHNLGVTPELVITKSRSQALGWVVWTTSLTNTDYWIRLDDTMAQANSPVGYGGTFSASNYTIANTGPYNALNNAGSTYVAYLFATCAGVSKVGSYTGTGATQTINCGFTGGARWVMVKRTDSTGDWYVWDTTRGMVAGTDPSLLLNSTAAEVNANSIYTATTGFQIVSTAAGINASGGTYIFLAIA